MAILVAVLILIKIITGPGTSGVDISGTGIDKERKIGIFLGFLASLGLVGRRVMNLKEADEIPGRSTPGDAAARSLSPPPLPISLRLRVRSCRPRTRSRPGEITILPGGRVALVFVVPRLLHGRRRRRLVDRVELGPVPRRYTLMAVFVIAHGAPGRAGEVHQLPVPSRRSASRGSRSTWCSGFFAMVYAIAFLLTDRGFDTDLGHRVLGHPHRLRRRLRRRRAAAPRAGGIR